MSARKLLTQCVLLPKEDVDVEEVVNCVFKQDNNVCCGRLRMPFDVVQESMDDYSLSSLTKKASQGDSTMLIMCGDRNEAHWVELLRACVTELLELAQPDGMGGLVKLYWFMVGADGAENLVDVLKTFQTPPTAHKNVELVLRELTAGRGMIVPGLIEVELNSIEDLNNIFEHMQSQSVGAFLDTSSHSVVQLSFLDRQKAAAAIRARKKDFVAQGALHDPAGLGRITILHLSNLRSQGPKVPTTTQNGTSPQRVQCPLPPTRTTFLTRIEPPSEPVRIDFVTEAGGFYPWIEHSRQVIQWMENKRASTPFHKSRLLLLLKDVLLRRQSAMMMLCLQPSAAQLNHHEDWLRVTWLLSRDFAPAQASFAQPVQIKKKHPRYDLQGSASATVVDAADSSNTVDNVETASTTWVFPGEDELTVNSRSVHSLSPAHRPSVNSRTPTQLSSPVDSDSVHWRAAMRARAMDYARAHSPRRRSRSHSLSRRPSRGESPRSPSEAQNCAHTPMSLQSNRSRVNSIDSRLSSLESSVGAGWDRTTTPGRSTSRPRVRLQLQAESSPQSNQSYRELDNQNAFLNESTRSPTSTSPMSPLTASGGTPSALAHQKRFFRSTLERIEGQIFDGAHGTAPIETPRRTKPASPKPRIKLLTSKEMSAAMRVLANRNKKAAEVAMKNKDELLGASTSTALSTTSSAAEVEDLKKRLAEAQGRCTTLETEQGVPLTYPTYDPNLFYTKWGPISPSKRRASVQHFLQAHGAAVDPTGGLAGCLSGGNGEGMITHGVPVLASRSHDSAHHTTHSDAVHSLHHTVGGGDRVGQSRDKESLPSKTSVINRIFGEALDAKEATNDEETDVYAEDEGEEGKSVEEQLREALESVRAWELKYQILESKYNALLAAQSVSQMQDNPMSAMSARRASSVQKEPPTVIAAAPPPSHSSSLSVFFPSNETIAAQSSASAPSNFSTSSVSVVPDAQAKPEQIPQNLPQELEPGINEAFSKNTFLVYEELKNEKESSHGLLLQRTVCSVDETPSPVSSAKIEVEEKVKASAPSSMATSPSHDLARPIVTAVRQSLARTSIRTSPIPADSIPSVSPIRFQRTRRAPREPSATPFESSFQASDYLDSHESVSAPWTPSAAGEMIVNDIEDKVDPEPSALNTDFLLPASAVLKEETKNENITSKLSAEISDTPQKSALESEACSDVVDQGEALQALDDAPQANAVSEAKVAEAVETQPKPEHMWSQGSDCRVSPTKVTSCDELPSVGDDMLSLFPTNAHATQTSKISTSSPEETATRRPISARLPFQPKIIMPFHYKENDTSASKLESSPASETPRHETVSCEEIHQPEASGAAEENVDKVPGAAAAVPGHTAEDASANSLLQNPTADVQEQKEKTTQSFNSVAVPPPPRPPSPLPHSDLTPNSTDCEVEGEQHEHCEFQQVASFVPAPPPAPLQQSKPSIMTPALEQVSPCAPTLQQPLQSHRMSISKTRVPQFLEHRSSSPTSSDDDEHDQNKDNGQARHVDETAVEQERPQESVETKIDHLDAQVQQESAQSEEIVPAKQMHQEALPDRQGVTRTIDVVEEVSSIVPKFLEVLEVNVSKNAIAPPVPPDSASLERTSEPASVLPVSSNVPIESASANATAVTAQSPTFSETQNQNFPAPPSAVAVVMPVVSTQDPTYEQENEVILPPFPLLQTTPATPVAKINPPSSAHGLPSSIYKDTMNDLTEGPVQHEGMYAQLAHAASPMRNRDAASISPRYKEVDESTTTEPTTAQDLQIEKIEGDDEVEEYSDEMLPDNATAASQVPSDLQPVLESGLYFELPPEPVTVHSGLYAQLAHSTSPVRPVSVPNPALNSGADAVKTKTLKSSRWSWLKKKST